MNNVITLVKKKRLKTDKQGLNVLRTMTEKLEAGELKCVIVIGVLKDGGYSRGWSRVGNKDLLPLIGAVDTAKAELISRFSDE